MEEGGKFDSAQIQSALATLDGWEAGNDRIRKNFLFPDFITAWGFMSRAALVAEHLDHHPNWFNCYGSVEVTLWTHRAGGVTGLDIRLAMKMNELARGTEVAPSE